MLLSLSWILSTEISIEMGDTTLLLFLTILKDAYKVSHSEYSNENTYFKKKKKSWHTEISVQYVLLLHVQSANKNFLVSRDPFFLTI